MNKQEIVELFEHAKSRFHSFQAALMMDGKFDPEIGRVHRINTQKMAEMCKESQAALSGWLERNADYKLDEKRNEYHFVAKDEHETQP